MPLRGGHAPAGAGAGGGGRAVGAAQRWMRSQPAARAGLCDRGTRAGGRARLWLFWVGPRGRPRGRGGLPVPAAPRRHLRGPLRPRRGGRAARARGPRLPELTASPAAVLLPGRRGRRRAAGSERAGPIRLLRTAGVRGASRRAGRAGGAGGRRLEGRGGPRPAGDRKPGRLPGLSWDRQRVSDLTEPGGRGGFGGAARGGARGRPPAIRGPGLPGGDRHGGGRAPGGGRPAGVPHACACSEGCGRDPRAAGGAAVHARGARVPVLGRLRNEVHCARVDLRHSLCHRQGSRQRSAARPPLLLLHLGGSCSREGQGLGRVFPPRERPWVHRAFSQRCRGARTRARNRRAGGRPRCRPRGRGDESRGGCCVPHLWHAHANRGGVLRRPRRRGAGGGPRRGVGERNIRVDSSHRVRGPHWGSLERGGAAGHLEAGRRDQPRRPRPADAAFVCAPRGRGTPGA